MSVGYWIISKMSALLNNREIKNNYFRRQGMKIGKHCLICSDISSREPMLIEVGNDVTISTDVHLVTHDNSIKLILPEGSNLFGRIKIGNRCFIGERSLIMYGVDLADEIIVAAGSVVTKSFTENRIIIGGVPAKKIGTWDDMKEKYQGKSVKREKLKGLRENSDDFLVKRSVR